MIITLDGPAASGKTTVGKLLAQRLKFDYLYSGFLYRALAYMLIKYKKYSIDTLPSITAQELEKAVIDVPIDYCFLSEGKSYVTIRGTQIEDIHLMNPEIDKASSMLALNDAVRKLLTEVQRKLVVGRNVIVDGRDAGSVAFPQADYKFFLTASVAVRAERYVKRQQKFGKICSIQEAAHIITERDTRDEHWLTGTKNVPDIIIIDTSEMKQETVVSSIIQRLPINI
jgi:cytidylate kinase